jgi:uncharacterized protein DUF6680
MQAPAPVQPVIWHGLPADIWLSFATILAIILGPILAVQVERHLEDRREARRRKIALFRELMVTRGSRLSARHVEALNGIQMEFQNKGKEKKVVDAWKLYITHLNTAFTPETLNVWAGRSEDLLTELLFDMGECLGYEFEKSRIKSEAYVPKLFGEIETEQTALRKECLAVFKGDKRLKVEVHNEEPEERPHLGFQGR